MTATPAAPPLATVPPPGAQGQYRQARLALLDRVITVWRHHGCPAGPPPLHSLLSDDGRTVYADGWGAGRSQPAGPGAVLYLAPGRAAQWRQVPDVSAPVAWATTAGTPAALIRKAVLGTRWVYLAVPAGVPIGDRRKPSNWFDSARAEALLTAAAYALWRDAQF